MKKTLFYITLLILTLVACDNNEDMTTAASPDTEVAVTYEFINGNTADTTNTVDTNGTVDITARTDVSKVADDLMIVRLLVNEWEVGNYRSLIETFEADNPDIEIQIVSIEEVLGGDADGMEPWSDAAAERLFSAADVVGTYHAGSFYDNSHLMLDLQPFVESDPGFNRDDFYPNALEYFESDGVLLGVPTQLNFTLLFYNKNALVTADVTEPEAGWSWDDFLTAAKAATVEEEGAVVQWGFVDPGRDPFKFLLPHTGPLVDTTADPPTPQMNRSDVATSLQWYVDLYLLHEVAWLGDAPYSDEVESGAGVYFMSPEFELIDSGKVAIWTAMSGIGNWETGSNVGVIPLPVIAPDDHTTPIHAFGYHISAGTRNPEAAWRWVKFLTQQPSSDAFNRNTAVPARPSVAEADGFWERIDSEYAEALRYALNHSYIYKFIPGYGALYEAIQTIFTEGQTVAAALTVAQANAEIEIADYIAEQASVTK